MTHTMRDRVRLALDLAPGAVPPRFEAAYRRGGTPTSLHLATLAEAAGTSPRWLMTGQPEEHAPTEDRTREMSDEQQPAEYRRTDPSKEPRTPAGQMAAVEGMAAAAGFLPADNPKLTAHNRKMLRRQFGTVDESTPAGRFQAQMLAAIEQFERERRAEILTDSGDPDEDRDPFEAARAIADEWADTASDADRRAALLDRLAERLDTTEVRALRLAAEAAAAITPRLIYADADQGVSVAATAEDLGVSEGYVYRILRKRPQ